MDATQLQLRNQICFPLYSASRLMTKAYKPYLEEMGLTYPQYLVMLVLWENDQLTVNKISETLLLNTNTISPLLKRMEKMEILKRSRSDKDERSVIIQLTDYGKQLKTKAFSIPEKLLSDIVSDAIGIDDLMKFKQLLNDFVSALSADDEISDQ